MGTKNTMGTGNNGSVKGMKAVQELAVLEDLITAAVNQAFRQMEEDSAAAMARLTGGMGGGFPFRWIITAAKSAD